MRAIYRKEMKSYFRSLPCYLFLFGFLLVGGYSFTVHCLADGASDISKVFSDLAIAMIALTPLLTMRIFWSDRSTGVLKQIFASRATAGSIVLGKYFAALTIVGAGMVMTLMYMLLLVIFGSPHFGETVIAYIGFALISAVMVAIGVFLSALTSRRVTAAVSTVAALFCMWSINTLLPAVPSGLLKDILAFFSLFSQLSKWFMGILSLPSAVYMISVSILFLLAACVILEHSRQPRKRGRHG